MKFKIIVAMNKLIVDVWIVQATTYHLRAAFAAATRRSARPALWVLRSSQPRRIIASLATTTPSEQMVHRQRQLTYYSTNSNIFDLTWIHCWMSLTLSWNEYTFDFAWSVSFQKITLWTCVYLSSTPISHLTIGPYLQDQPTCGPISQWTW